MVTARFPAAPHCPTKNAKIAKCVKILDHLEVSVNFQKWNEPQG